MAEACVLARRLVHGGEERVLEFVRRGALHPSFALANEIDTVAELVRKYREVPMSLADACLVRMSELHGTRPVFTLDRDFTIYRRIRRQRTLLLLPGVSPPGYVSAESGSRPTTPLTAMDRPPLSDPSFRQRVPARNAESSVTTPATTCASSGPGCQNIRPV
ncbi:type II toxin-antitoxin system VapC family toxin [Candidatus Palauibacter sp.]|uniref:type II toxin-antitoxin system VapC family toxin n=1 Tax=Candidatus Palauibacter sp. TaxID=3101350 RepID=UPI003B5BBDA3